MDSPPPTIDNESQDVLSCDHDLPSGLVAVAPAEPDIKDSPVPTIQGTGDSGDILDLESPQEQEITKEVVDQAPKPVSKPSLSPASPKVLGAGGGVKKPSIAAAIAVFEKNSVEKKPLLKSTAAVRKPTVSTLPDASKSPTAARTARSTVGPGATAAKRASLASAPKPPMPPALTANVTNPSLAKSSSAATPPVPASSGLAPTKPTPRVSTAARTAASTNGPKASAHDRTSSITSSQVKLTNNASAAPAATRRTSTLPATTKPTPRTATGTTNSAAARKPTMTTTSSSTALPSKIGPTSSNLANKRMSHAPHAIGTKSPAVNGNHTAAVAELENKLRQAELTLAQKTKSLSEVESQLEADAITAAAAHEKLVAEVQALELKLADAIDTSSRSVELSSAEFESSQAELSTAQARLEELTKSAEAQTTEHARLVEQHTETVALLSQLQKTVDSLQAELTDAHAKHENLLAELSEQHAQDLDSKLTVVREELGSQNHDLLSRLEAAETQSKQVEDDANSRHTAELADEVTRATNESASQHALALEELGSQHSAKLQSLKDQHESAIQKVRDDSEAELTLLQDKLKDSEARTTDLLNELEEKHKIALENAVVETRSSAAEEQSAKLAALQQEHDEVIRKLNADLTEIRSTHSALQTGRDELQSALETLRAEKADQENTLLGQIESLKAEHATKLQDEFQRARDELESGHIEQLQTFRHASQETTEQLLSSHVAEMAAIKAALRSDFESEKLNINSELNEHKLELGALRSDLAAARQTNAEQSTHIIHLTETLEAAKVSLKESESHVTAQGNDEEELKTLRQALSAVQAELQQTQSTLQETTKELSTKFEHSRERHDTEINQHIEAKTLLQKELLSLKEASENEALRVSMQQTMINEISEENQRETAKRAAVEAELNQLKAQRSSSGDAHAALTDQKLAELHKAHNAKTAELEGQLEQYKHVAAMAESQALEMKEKYELLEHLIQRDERQEDADGDYEGDTTVDQTASPHNEKFPRDKTLNLIDMSFDEA